MSQTPENSSPDDDAEFKLDQFFPYQLSILSNRVSNLIARAYEEKFDIRVPEWRVIVVLYAPGTLSASEIADRTLMDRVRVTRTLQALDKKGIVTRAQSETDGRSVRLSLTNYGREIYEEIIPLARDYEKEVLSTLSASDVKKLGTMISKLSDRLTDLENTQSR